MPPAARLTRVRRTSVAAEVGAYLEELIRKQLTPGDRLPPERELADQLAVSRSSVREALRELQQRRVVERRPGRGTVLLDAGPDARALLTGLSSVHPEAAHVAELRRVVEPQVAGLAAARASAGDLAALERTLAASSTGATPAESLELDLRFHAQIATAAGNPLLLTLCELAASLSTEVRARSHRTRRGRRSSLEAHRMLAEAIAAHDPGRASAAMVQHLADVERLVAGGTR